MHHWQYLFVTVDGTGRYRTNIFDADQQVYVWKHLDHLGKQGWELIHVGWEDKLTGHATAVFKRPDPHQPAAFRHYLER